ncbi:hypothetical protein [Gryllotalpicola koreensis]|uniref:Hemagglutinin n=1 Tax=Gryllotalpicola koreensis TaxID=993086 RepID=A0ABP8A1J8_9MICO
MLIALPGQRAEALSGSDFNAGEIISDDVFFNSNAMSVAQIQSFLQSQESGCTAANGQPCLMNFHQNTTSQAASAGRCNAYAGANNESAAQIIYKVAQACGINPQVILVTLEKEEALVSSKAPTSARYSIAMGYACPDTSACDTKYYGFFNQVYHAAWQFKEYAYEPSYWYSVTGKHIGNSAVRYSPTASCGSTTVNILNQATVGLYIYTPYTPNAAALNNLNGVGDSCSSYGNRNFWVFFNNWFGSPTDAGNVPYGHYDTATAGYDQLTVTGWAIDPNTTSPINVQVIVDGKVVATKAASLTRNDVAAAYPNTGNQHGFSVTVSAAAGARSVCITAVNVGIGSHGTSLGCRTVNVISASPVGHVDSASALPDGIAVSGWALDQQTTDPIHVNIYVDGKIVPTNFLANGSRPDLAGPYPNSGTNHGYSVSFAATGGTHNVCVYGINVGTGSNSLIGCRSVSVLPGGAPFGHLDALDAVAGGATVRGWALDPDTANPVAVHVYSNGQLVTVLTANGGRSDIAALYPAYGGAHGFSGSVQLAAGNDNVCLYLINQPSGSNPLLGCKTLSVKSGSPIGSVDLAGGVSGGVRVAGWALDPDTSASIPVHVYVGTTLAGALTAGNTRSDIGKAYPDYGSEHGYDGVVPAKPGSYNVCVYGINTGAGSNSLIGCKAVTVP